MTDAPLPGGDATPLDREAHIRLRYPLKTRGGWVPRQDIGFLLEQLTLARQQVEAREGTLAMTVARLGGTVEGAPTHRINFLQRIDQLVAIEQAYDEQRRDIDALLTVHRKALVRAESAEAQVTALQQERDAIARESLQAMVRAEAAERQLAAMKEPQS